MDWSAAAAWIALVVAIISPVVTTVMNNKVSLKEKELDFKNNVKTLSIIDFLEKAGKVTTHSDASNMAEYGAAFGRAFLFLPEDVKQAAIVFNNNVIDWKFSKDSLNYLISAFDKAGFTIE